MVNTVMEKVAAPQPHLKCPPVLPVLPVLPSVHQELQPANHVQSAHLAAPRWGLVSNPLIQLIEPQALL